MRTSWQGASGVPQPKFVIKHEDHDELVDANSQIPGETNAVDQLVVVLKDSRNIHIRLYSSMNAQAIRRRLDQLEINDEDISSIHWHSDEKNVALFKALLKELWPRWEQGELPVIESGVHKVPIRITCSVTQKYYRAIAKIALHYLLACTKCGFTGHEETFAPIRDFIMNGGESEQFFQNRKPQIIMPIGVMGDGRAVLPARWMHMLCCFESPSSAVVTVYTLFGPHRAPSPHFVTLMQNESSIIVKENRYGHVFVYGNPDLGDTESSFVEPIEINEYTVDRHLQ